MKSTGRWFSTGSVIEKLNYLAETKELLRKTLEEMGATVTDEDTFKSYAEKFANATPDTMYITNANINILGGNVTNKHSDLLGEYTPKGNDFICPRIVYKEPENSTKTGYTTIPFSPRTTMANYSAVISGSRADYQNVKFETERIRVRVCINMTKPIRLVLPDMVELNQYALINGTSGTDSTSFSEGLAFGKRVYGSVSNWMARSLDSRAITVKVPRDFQLRSGQTLYLNKINMFAPTLEEIIDNLHHYTDGTTRVIKLASGALGRISEEYMAKANEKGWIIE